MSAPPPQSASPSQATPAPQPINPKDHTANDAFDSRGGGIESDVAGLRIEVGETPNIYTQPGQAAYTPLVLRGFDFFVYRLAMHGDTRSAIAELYERNVRSPHLEAGAGTSYSLAHCRSLQPGTDLVLLDLNPNCLATSGQRLARYRPRLLQADVLRPLPLPDGSVASVGLCYVMSVLPRHVPGGKWQVVNHLARALTEDGTLFGVVSPGRGVRRSPAARARFWVYNRLKILDNEHDSLQELEATLRRHFEDVETRVMHGDVLFEARRKRRSTAP